MSETQIGSAGQPGQFFLFVFRSLSAEFIAIGAAEPEKEGNSVIDSD